MKVAIQGQAGSYHDTAQRQFFADATIVPAMSFSGVFDAVTNDRAEYGLIAIENSLYGSINRVYDLLLQHKPWVCGEVYLRIEHCLISKSKQDLKNITAVYSQHEALEQCREFFREHMPTVQLVETNDTAGSVAMLKDLPPTAAAVASQAAATLHNAHIIHKGIETNKQNYTRFIVFQKQKNYDLSGQNKTSVVIELPEKAGVLHEVLGLFAKAQINLSKIESRPIVGKAWHYMFYLDFDAGVDEPTSRDVLAKLQTLTTKCIILGSYKNSR
ncbi:TPA: ACT domain-containing protein [Candidatus Saccharibacteria bacterium]|nr:ACT domain-containing protein [Candidatus Saccharibacteria bacterium]HIO87643.1 ACT domain-containing protein [Candidatus Saccharibacteria bacterium]